MKQKIVMFDFDNTLVDSLKYWYYVQNKKMFKFYGKKVDRNFSKKRRGSTNLDAAKLFVSPFTFILCGVCRWRQRILPTTPRPG